MKIEETTKSTTADNLLQKKREPFFSKEGQGDFFSKASEPTTSFFVPPTIQPKLTIGQPNDKYEVEADAMADKIVQKVNGTDTAANIPLHNASKAEIQTKCSECEKEEKLQKKEGALPNGITSIQRKPIFESAVEKPEADVQAKPMAVPTVQTKCASCEEEQLQKQEDDLSGDELEVQKKAQGPGKFDNGGIARQLNATKGGGASLPEHVQASMDDAFGADFSGVRVHTDSNAVQMNKELGAQAFANGSDIYFNEGKYDPSTSKGQHLLAHELTHTVQQGASNVQLSPEPEEITEDLPAATEKEVGEEVAKPLKIFGFNSLYWLVDYNKKATYAELRIMANFNDLSNYLYGNIDQADTLATFNNRSVTEELGPGTRIIVGSKALKGPKNSKLALGHYNNAPIFPTEITSPKQALADMGVADQRKYKTLKELNKNLLQIDFNFVVMILNSSYYSDADENRVIQILTKWAENKFVGNLNRYAKYKDGGYYLDKMFMKLRGKMKDIGGVFSSEITSYYDLIFNHFDKVGQVKALKNKYSADYKKDNGIKEMSFFQDVVVDTVTGIPGGLTAGAGGLAGALGWEGGEEWFKERGKDWMEMVGYCDSDPECINQAIEGSALVGGVVTEVGTMVYGGPIFKAVNMIQTISNLGELKSIKTSIDLLMNSKTYLATATSWFSDPEKLLLMMLGVEGEGAAAINKMEVWANSAVKEPELKGKETAFGNERAKLKSFIKKIVGILKKIKETLKVIFNIRRKFVDFMGDIGVLIAGLPIFLKLMEQLEKAPKNKKEVHKLVKKLTSQLGDKLQEFLLGGKTFLLALIQNFEESVMDFQIKTQEVASAITPFILAFVGKKIKMVKAVGAVPQIRAAISKYVVEPMIPEGTVDPINNSIQKVVKGFQPAIINAKNGVSFLYEHASVALKEQITPNIENLFIQRSASDNGSSQPVLPDTHIEGMMGASKGSPLPTDFRNEMEEEFQQDFSKVKVHTDLDATEAAEGIQADAFTQNKDIYFGKDKYAPNTTPGKHLLAHELTHVVHQNGSGQKNTVQRSYKKTLDSFVRKFGSQVLKSMTGVKSRSKKDRAEAVKILRIIRKQRLIGKRVDEKNLPDIKTITKGAYSFVFDKKSGKPKAIRIASKWKGLLPRLTIRRSKIQVGLLSQFSQKEKETDENQAVLKDKVGFEPMEYKAKAMGKQVDSRFSAKKNVRPTKVFGHIDQMKNKVGRDAHFSASKLPGNEPGDHGGHLLGDRFYGPGTRKNLVPMTADLNLSRFPNQFEGPMANWIKAKNAAATPWVIYVTISAKYDDTKKGRKKMRPVQVNAWAKGFTGTLDSVGRMKVTENTISRNSFTN